MKKSLVIAAVLAMVMGLHTVGTAQPSNSIIIPDMTVPAGASDVVISVRLANNVAIRSFAVPLIIRDVNPGGFPTAIRLAYRERLLGTILYDIEISNQYSQVGSQCKGNTPGGFTNADFSDTLKHATSTAPWGVLFSRTRIFAPNLEAGGDSSGSLVMIADIGPSAGVFEVDTTCGDPSIHPNFVADNNSAIVPAVTPGTITVTGGECDCPHQGDVGPRSTEFDGVINLVDVVTLIDEIFFNGESAVTDPQCPRSRADVGPRDSCGDGVIDVVDLLVLMDHAFSSGAPICNPCVID